MRALPRGGRIELESTALILTHENSNFIGGIPCVQMAQRGYTVLCVKSQYSQQAEADWDELALDVSASVSYLRSLSTVQHVVLVGYSGGGPIMSFYQNVAENGVKVCQKRVQLDPCSNDLANMPPADGVVLLDSEGGVAFKGATHGFTPCTACATTPGEFGDTVAETFNDVSNWLDARYN